MDKVNEFYNTVIEILSWAVGQGHINDEQRDILARNITQAKEDL